MNSNNNNNNNNNKFRRSFRKLKSFNLVDAENWWVRFSLAKEASVCVVGIRGLVRVWKFCDSDNNSDDDSSSSSSSDDDASDFEKTTPKGGRRDKNVRASTRRIIINKLVGVARQGVVERRSCCRFKRSPERNRRASSGSLLRWDDRLGRMRRQVHLQVGRRPRRLVV